MCFQIAPQVSVYQSPTLEILSLVNQAIAKKLPNIKKLSLLKELVPFVNGRYIPLFQDKTGGVKFGPVQDLLLLNGLAKFSSKCLGSI